MFSSPDHPVTSTMPVNDKCHHTRGHLIPNKLIQVKIDVLSMVIPDMLKDSNVQMRSTSVSPVTSMDILQAHKSKLPTTSHLITNLAYKLKPHHKRNQYLRARLDTCADVNIMPASVYKLVFQDPDLKNLAPSKLETASYTTNTVKLVGFCTFHLVHPDTKKPQEVTFYVTSNNGSVLLSCATTCSLGLIQPHTKLDYLPCSCDHPKKTKWQPAIPLSQMLSWTTLSHTCRSKHYPQVDTLLISASTSERAI